MNEDNIYEIACKLPKKLWFWKEGTEIKCSDVEYKTYPYYRLDIENGKVIQLMMIRQYDMYYKITKNVKICDIYEKEFVPQWYKNIISYKGHCDEIDRTHDIIRQMVISYSHIIAL